MATVLRFPLRRHAHAPRRSAASSTIVSDVKPARSARGRAKTADHHSAGMLSRCHHFSTAAGSAPISPANDRTAARRGLSGDGNQSSMIERKDLIVTCDLPMTESLGQIVLNRKMILSCDCAAAGDKYPAMPKAQPTTAFRRDFIARTRWARIGRSFTQAQAADLLGLAQDKYKQYESRTLLPHELVARFCLLCGIDESWLFTAKGRAPAIPEPPRQEPRKRPVRRRAKAA